MSAAVTPARARAARPASVARPAVVPPTLRSWIPVRATIHSSLVSSRVARSAFVTVLSGSAVPQPVITAPRLLISRLLPVRSPRPQPHDGLAGGDPFPLDCDVGLTRTGEGRADLVIPDSTHDLADDEFRARIDIDLRGEHPRR